MFTVTLLTNPETPVLERVTAESDPAILDFLER